MVAGAVRQLAVEIDGCCFARSTEPGLHACSAKKITLFGRVFFVENEGYEL
jgi:hypothetical protein